MTYFSISSFAVRPLVGVCRLNATGCQNYCDSAGVQILAEMKSRSGAILAGARDPGQGKSGDTMWISVDQRGSVWISVAGVL